MFSKSPYSDFSYDLRDKRAWKVEALYSTDYLYNATVFALEPLSGLLAVGTLDGTVNVFGAPPIFVELRSPEYSAVKIVLFASLVFKLVVVDQRDTLRIWDLSTNGSPKLEKSENFKRPIRSILLSACHSHALIAMQTGEIIAYDLLCLRTSPSRIPNLWKSFEDKMLAIGLETDLNPSLTSPMDVLHHPRDLNILFVAYAGGVVLYNISEEHATRHFQLDILPGAPGGIGYGDPNILQPRRPLVTCIAIHPSGHYFAVGHADGCIAFWAIDDEDKPLMVRTLDDLAVNVVDAEKLTKILESRADAPDQAPAQPDFREPIFKLSWSPLSEASAEATVLTILGGLRASDSAGVTSLLLPSLSHVPLSETPAPKSDTAQLSPDIRAAIIDSLQETKSFFYQTSGPTQDFLLVPRGSPHFAGTADPIAIMLLSDGQHGKRTFSAFEFPPPLFADDNPTTAPVQELQETEHVLGDDFASALESLHVSRDPQKFTLPLPLSIGDQGLLDGGVTCLTKDPYSRLTGLHESSRDIGPYLLKGGQAYHDSDLDNPSDLKFAKYQIPRIFATHNADFTIRFHDISTQLLLPTNQPTVETAFPNPLHGLTINLLDLFADPSLAALKHPLDTSTASVDSVQLIPESLDCVVVFSTGHVAIFHPGGHAPQADSVEEDELVHFSSPLPWKDRIYAPMLMIQDTHGPIACTAHSSIGLLAIAYASSDILVVDMTRSLIIMREGADKEHRSLFKSSEARHKVDSMKWAICGMGNDSKPQVRLLVAEHSGTTKIYTLEYKANVWEPRKGVEKVEGISEPLQDSPWVIDNKTGELCLASKRALGEVMGEPTLYSSHESKTPKNDANCFCISTGAKGIKSVVNLTGSVAGKADWGKGKTVECANVVSKSGASSFVAITLNREVLVYSLPSLDDMHTFQYSLLPSSVINVDYTGDCIEMAVDERSGVIKKTRIGTLFNVKRPSGKHVIDLLSAHKPVPPAPQPVPLAGPSKVDITTSLGSMLGYGRSISGDQFDALLAGPDRPLPKPTSAMIDMKFPSEAAKSAQAIANSGYQMGSDLYSSLTNAINERGDTLTNLQDRFQSLESGSRAMVNQAKRLAAEQTAKGWFSSWTG